MFMGNVQQSQQFRFSSKGLFQVWRHELKIRRSDQIYCKNLIKKYFNNMAGVTALNQGRSHTSRLYNEIRLIKNYFYKWFTTTIEDRLAFSKGKALAKKKNLIIKINVLEAWRRKTRAVNLIEQKSNALIRIFNERQVSSAFSSWRLLVKHHTARYIWTANFRNTEDIRELWTLWLRNGRNQIISDTIYQSNLTRTSLNKWRTIFDARQDRRFELKRHFCSWRKVLQGNRAFRFYSGQSLLRKLSVFKSATPEILSQAMERSGINSTSTSSSFSQLNSDFIEFDYGLTRKSKSVGSVFSSRILKFYQWRGKLNRLLLLEEEGDVFLLRKLQKIIQIWRLKIIYKNLEETESCRLAVRLIRQLKFYLQSQREKSETADRQLFHFYTERAIKLEKRYFQIWESSFQVTRVSDHFCDQILRVQWNSIKKSDNFHKWQLLTAGKIFSKCQKITQQQQSFSAWRQNCKTEISTRNRRILSKHFSRWKHENRCAKLERSKNQFLHVKRKKIYFEKFKNLYKKRQINHSRSFDFFYITRGLSTLNVWRERVKLIRSFRERNQKSLMMNTLRVPLVRKPRIEQLMATAMSLSDLSVQDNEADFSGNLNVAELSV